MKIYKVVNNNWQDYEGGGGQVEAVYDNVEAAIAHVNHYYPDYVKAPDELMWDHPTQGQNDRVASHYWITIDEEEVLSIFVPPAEGLVL